MCDVTKQSDYPRNVVNLEQIMEAPSNDDIRTLVESARDEALVERRHQNIVVHRDTSFLSFLGLVNDLTSLRLDCCHVSWVSHLGGVLLSHLPKFHSSMMLLCP